MTDRDIRTAHISLDTGIMDRIDVLAKAETISRSSWIRRAILAALRSQEAAK